MKILDCTLRDGGYYTNWDFDYNIVEAYIRDINELPIDYIELGYRNLPNNEYLGEFAYCPISTIQHIRTITTKRLAIMLNEKDCDVTNLSQLLLPIVGLVDMVRLAVDPKNFDRAIDLAREVKFMGFEVAFNTMYMSTWEAIDGFYSQLSKLDDVVDLFCMVDSFGSVTPNNVKDIINKVKQSTSCILGFHGHDNLSLGLANAIVAIENGVEIVDSTILGMGRGAGNLKTELLLTYLNKHHDLNVDFNALSRITGSFEPLLKLHNWGANLPYMLSGANSIPQKDVMEWVQNRIYSFNSIVRALDNRKSLKYDNAKYPVLKINNQYSKVLIVGGGESVTKHVKAIKTFIKTYNVALVFATARFARLFNDLQCPKFFCLLGNESKRLSANIDTQSQFMDTCVLPPYPRKMGTDVPRFVHDNTYELPSITFIDKYQDSCTTLAVELAQMLKANDGDIFVVGYDGYQGHVLTEKELTLNRENEEIFSKYSSWINRKIISLLPTMYKSVDVKSLYNLL